MPDLIQRPPPPSEYLEPIEQDHEEAPWDELLNKLLSDYKAILDLLPPEDQKYVMTMISHLIWEASSPFVGPSLLEKPARVTRYLDRVRLATSRAPLRTEILKQLGVFQTTLEAYIKWVDTVENVIALSDYVSELLGL